MRLAILADIHGNIDAANAVFEDIESFSPDIVITAGDMIGGGPDPKSVLELVEEKSDFVVRGNHEELTLGVNSGEIGTDFTYARIALAEAEMIGETWMKRIAMMPNHRIIALTGDVDVCVAHGIPNNTRKTILHNSREDDLNRSAELQGRYLSRSELMAMLEKVSVSLFITAHSHSQFTRAFPATSVLNPGAVAGEFCYSKRQVLAEYAIADLFKPRIGGYVWNIVLRQVNWDESRMYDRFSSVEKEYPIFREMIDLYKNRKEKLAEMQIR